MKAKVLSLLLLLTSLMGYLEWGGGNSAFLFQAEAEVISKLVTDPTSAAHPFTLLPLIGQLLLLVTLFQKRPSTFVTFTGLAAIGILLVFMFVIGLVSLNFMVILSTIPFLIIGFMTIWHHRHLARASSQ